MKFLLVLALSVCLIGAAWAQQQDNYEDNDFAEFEDFDSEDDYVGAPAGSEARPKSKEVVDDKNDEFQELNDDEDAVEEDDEDGVVEEEDSEFEHFHDEEEFEGFKDGSEGQSPPAADLKTGEPKLTVAKVPMHFRTHWDSYWMEMIMLAGLAAYFANFFIGKSKNSKLANQWLQSHRQILEENFVLVGDDGKLENESHGLLKESESLYTLWCSGRTCCEGMLVELKMIKRQDLVNIISGMMRRTQDQIHVKVEVSKEAMDTFVFCVAAKRATAAKLFKETSDLNKFCTLVNNSSDKYNVPKGFTVLSELPEASSAVLDSRIVGALKKYAHLIDYIQVSDQFCGPVQQEDPATLKQPDVKRMLICVFNMPDSNGGSTASAPLLELVFYLLERLKRFRLSKESKNKADKNRSRVEELFLKSTHAARAEAAAQRREDKRKQEKDKVLAEDDPEKQRRWEKKEQKRQAKKKAPKMKQLSIKAM